MIVFAPSSTTMSADAATRTRERMRFFESVRKAKRHLETAMDIVLYYSSYV